MVDTHTMLSRSFNFQIARKEREAARYVNEAAISRYTIAEIREREAELASQAFQYVGHGGLKKTLGEITDREREIGIAFARYVICGRTD